MGIQNSNKKKGAPIGNDFWRLVKNPGRPKKYTPGSLWNVALKYFAWVTKHPLKEKKVFGTGYSTYVNKMRAMTETAFCLFAGIDENTWQRYKGHDEYKEFWAVSGTIAKVIYVSKFEGAAADLLNGNIIARELGLLDKQSMQLDFDSMSDEQLDLIIEKLKNSAKK